MVRTSVVAGRYVLGLATALGVLAPAPALAAKPSTTISSSFTAQSTCSAIQADWSVRWTARRVSSATVVFEVWSDAAVLLNQQSTTVEGSADFATSGMFAAPAAVPEESKVIVTAYFADSRGRLIETQNQALGNC